MACTREQGKYNFETSKGMELSDFWVPAAPVSISVVQVNFKVCSLARSIGDQVEKFAIILIWRDIVIWDLWKSANGRGGGVIILS